MLPAGIDWNINETMPVIARTRPDNFKNARQSIDLIKFRGNNFSVASKHDANGRSLSGLLDVAPLATQHRTNTFDLPLVSHRRIHQANEFN
jgi:hypothetical protein